MQLRYKIGSKLGGDHKLEAFASHYGADFYGLPRNQGQITLIKQDQTIPEIFSFGDSVLVPFRANETCAWQLQQ